MSDSETVYAFGKNWENYVKSHLSDDRIDMAREHLLSFLEMEDLRGRYFLDIGCGSGIHSLGALLAGSEKVVSFDVDPFSVKTAETVREKKGGASNWEIREGSILDREFLSGISPADIVYSWGVLHHTGDMWNAIRNAAGMMKPDGLFYIALYTKSPASDYWLRVKKRYNRASSFRRLLMEFWYVARFMVLPDIAWRRNPLKRFLRYKESRGMSWMTDVRDWLGGYPFEDASIEEVLRFGRKELGLELVNIATGEANTEYLFRKR